jgi:ATP-dependent Zn protease
MTTSDDLSGTTFHEAGHAVVAWSLGIPVARIAIGVDGDEAAGEADISTQQNHLPLVDRIAIWLSGIEAQDLFRCPTNQLAGRSDLGNVARIILDEGLSEDQSKEVRKAGRQRARELILKHEGKVRQLAARLVERHQIDGSEFLSLMNATD